MEIRMQYKCDTGYDVYNLEDITKYVIVTDNNDGSECETTITLKSEFPEVVKYITWLETKIK